MIDLDKTQRLKHRRRIDMASRFLVARCFKGVKFTHAPKARQDVVGTYSIKGITEVYRGFAALTAALNELGENVNYKQVRQAVHAWRKIGEYEVFRHDARKMQ